MQLLEAGKDSKKNKEIEMTLENKSLSDFQPVWYLFPKALSICCLWSEIDGFVLLELTHMYICLLFEGDSLSEGIGNRFSRENICSALMLASGKLGVLRKKNFILVVQEPHINKLTKCERQTSFIFPPLLRHIAWLWPC